MSESISAEQAIDSFIDKWKNSGGSERSNYQLFLTELCDQIGVDHPDPAQAETELNNYVFERNLRMLNPDGSESSGFIDLYKKNSFICETKQGVEKKENSALSDVMRERVKRRRKGHGERGTKGWDEVMVKARNQAERYVRGLPPEEGRPPFILVMDVGHCIEVFSEFSCTGGTYIPFPDPRNYRIALENLSIAEIRDRLRLIWSDPMSLDPSRHSARVTRKIAEKLAALSRSMEASGHPVKSVAEFIMRSIFTMFAEDVNLIPKESFTELLENLVKNPDTAHLALETLWKAMDKGGWCPLQGFTQIRKLKQFNGGLFSYATALPLTEDQIHLLIDAAKADWRYVEPAIFGTLLERALDEKERHKLGAHYTPRAYVERLVMPTIIEPLREEWEAIVTSAIMLKADAGENRAKADELDRQGRHKSAASHDGQATKSENEARKLVEAFHHKLCRLRVLDPACGSGNFLYVTLEHLKRLEGEVLNFLSEVAGQQAVVAELDHATVRPVQMLGIEINPRAAVIAELVLWIGYLQWHIRTNGNAEVSEPVLEDARNIQNRDAVLAYDRADMVLQEDGRPVTRWDGHTMKIHPVTGKEVPDEKAVVPVYSYTNPRPAQWPRADYIVGNPPFIGASRMRHFLGDGYTETIRKTIRQVPESADFVIYWWNKAAELVRTGAVNRFGFVTTNSISQTFNRRVVEKHINSKNPLSIRFAIPDHPWVDSADAAAVRVAMTVGQAGQEAGELKHVRSEKVKDDGTYDITFENQVGVILPDLSIGPDVTSAKALMANSDISNPGVKLHGSGFIISKSEAKNLGLGKIPGLEKHIRTYRNGKDLTQKLRGVMVIDLFGLTAEEVLEKYPAVYQWVYERVKPERDHNKRESRRRNWWLFGETNPKLRKQLKGLPRYITTIETSKHRFFTFLDEDILPDNMLVNIAIDEDHCLGILSSKVHVQWIQAQGGTLGSVPRYNKTRCFETFPFPDCSGEQQQKIGHLGEQLDQFRKARLAEHPELTMTGLYNVLEKLRAGEVLSKKEMAIHEKGLITVLKEHHDALDAAVIEAYGWPANIGDEEILYRLVDLNKERKQEESRGLVRWLRPEFQAPGASAVQLEDSKITAGTAARASANIEKSKPVWPKALPDQVRALHSLLVDLPEPAGAIEIARFFKNARRDRVEELLETLVAMGQARNDKDGRFAA